MGEPLSLRQHWKTSTVIHVIRVVGTVGACCVLVQTYARADLRIEPPAPAPTPTNAPVKAVGTNTPQGSDSSAWHFQATYGISSADVETPAWNNKSEPATAIQKSTTGVFTEKRFNHSLELGNHPRQATRVGLSLVNAQSASATGWMKSLAEQSRAPDWRAWGIGTDVFLVRHVAANLDLDAGLQADYFISGVATLPSTDAVSTEAQTSPRLEQKMGWRLAFSGGIGGLYMGPLGLILRMSGHVIQAQFQGHTQPLRIQGVQFQIGAGLALGRGEP